MGIGVGPDMAAIGKKAVGLDLQKGRVGEQGGGERLKRKADAGLLHHVRLAAIVGVGLDGAGPQQHVEAEVPDARQVPQKAAVTPRRSSASRRVGKVWVSRGWY